ncbi:hypothetical protein ACTM6I_24145 [Citrobacter freundii]
MRPEPGAMACTWGSRASASPGRQSSSVPCRWRGGAAAGKWRGHQRSCAPGTRRDGLHLVKPRQRITGAAIQLCTLPLARRRSCRKMAGASAQLCARNPARWQTLDERLSDAYTIRKKRW